MSDILFEWHRSSSLLHSKYIWKLFHSYKRWRSIKYFSLLLRGTNFFYRYILQNVSNLHLNFHRVNQLGSWIFTKFIRNVSDRMKLIRTRSITVRFKVNFYNGPFIWSTNMICLFADRPRSLLPLKFQWLSDFSFYLQPRYIFAYYIHVATLPRLLVLGHTFSNVFLPYYLGYRCISFTGTCPYT